MESIIALQALEDTDGDDSTPIHGQFSSISVFGDCSSNCNSSYCTTYYC